jgi:segregation and condensation protein B
MTPRGEMEAALEAILFVSAEPVPRARLLELFAADERAEAAAALDAVLARYPAAEGRGVMVDEVAGGVRLVTRPELGGWLRRFFEVRGGHKLSMAALETLAIIAYRQPITGPEIQELRSVNPAGVLKTLLERRLVRIAGRKAVVGNPFLYRTTREFLVHFGLGDLGDLPPLEELEEMLGGEEGADVGEGEVPAGDEDGGEAGEEGAAGEGVDREEEILRRAAELDEAEEEWEAGEEEAGGGGESAPAGERGAAAAGDEADDAGERGEAEGMEERDEAGEMEESDEAGEMEESDEADEAPLAVEVQSA